MSINKRTNQGGSTAAFLIVAIILLIGLAGAVYYAKQRGEIARKEKAIATIQDESTQENQTENPFDESDDESDATTDESANDDSELDTAEELPVGGAIDTMNIALAIFSITTSSVLYLASTRELKSTL